MTLLERDDHLNGLDDALRASRNHGQFAVVSGEAGVGKTSLLEAFAARGRASFLWGACESLSTPRPLGPLLDMAGDLGGDVDALLTASAPRHHVFAAFMASVARRTVPTVVVFEDVHWADEATLDLLRYVSRRAHRVAALVVVTWRADEVGADHPLYRLLGELPSGATHRFELRPLSLDAVTCLAQSTEEGQRVFALTGGNPFLVTELLRTGGAGVPASVREAILARRAGLSNESRQIVDLMAVVPSHVDIDMVRAGVASVTEAVMPAVEAGLLTFDGRALGFRHELARLAVFESLPLLRTQELHRTALSLLSPFAERPGVLSRLAHHAVGANDGCAVLRFAPEAARQAAARGAHREAVAHYRTALEWADHLDARARATIMDALAYEGFLTGDMAASRDARTDALASWRALGETRAVGRNLRWLSRLAWFLGDLSESKRCATEALDVLSVLDEDEELAMALSNRACLHMLAHEHQASIALGERAIGIARRLGSIEVLSHALNNVGTSRIHGGDAAGRQLLEESLSLALCRDLHDHAARAYTNLASSAIKTREYEYACRWIETGLSYSTERDLDSWGLCLLAWHARLLAETGRWPQAADVAHAVIGNTQVSVVAKIPALTTLGLLRARQRSHDATRLLDEAFALALRTEEKQRLVPVRAARAEHALLQGRLHDARAEADAGLAMLGSTDSHWDAELLAYLRWRAIGGTGSNAIGLCSAGPQGPHGLLLCGDWRTAADRWERIGCPYERAEALADGDVPAREEAFQAFVALGAWPAADRVRQGLRRAGVTRVRRGPRSTTRAHPAGLTQRESEVLMLLARQLSNPAIGERLFVSPKTVEHHVSAILGKLDVCTRDEAVEEARRRGWLTEGSA
jgi:DNA-binding CsgD family transcriptional regulator/tetratricopeptide (TPR) repeat protein